MQSESVAPIGMSGRSAWLRLRTLVILRWLAIAGQIAAVAAASLAFGVDLRLDLCIAVIGASVSFNLIALSTQPANKRLTETSAMFTLLFDLGQLVVLLYLTGGLSNPFSLLVIAPVTISATALTLSATFVVGSCAIAAISLLVFYHLPLQLMDGTIVAPPVLLTGGMWASLVIGIVFLAGYARRVTVEAFSMSQALSATQMALAREQQLTALGGVVAAAAHELGTPLATIKLVSSELEEELSERMDLLEDVRLIRSQTERCRDILRDMGRGGRDDALLKQALLSAVVMEAADPHLDRGKTVIFRVDGMSLEDADADVNQPEIQRRPEIIHGLRNLVQNAVDFAESTVWIDMTWDEDSLTVSIGDDGVGYPIELMGRIGDPYVRQRSRHKGVVERAEYEGMGLGLFIAKTLLERSGAVLSFANGAGREGKPNDANDTPVEFAQASGALVDVEWSRADLETSVQNSRRPLGRNQLNLP